MTTTVDNNKSVFIVERLGISTKSIFCNIEDIPKILSTFEKNDPFQVSRYWNFKPKKLSKKGLNELFKANQINFKIK
jgi:hypothetical protein